MDVVGLAASGDKVLLEVIKKKKNTADVNHTSCHKLSQVLKQMLLKHLENKASSLCWFCFFFLNGSDLDLSPGP